MPVDDNIYTPISERMQRITRLHEAICEGRRQDAIDILNEMSEWRLRSVSEMHNLFPERINP